MKKIPGIGADLADKIQEYVTTRKSKFYYELKNEVPSVLVDLLSVPGLGPKTVKMLYEKLHMKNIDDIENRAKDGAFVILSPSAPSFFHLTTL